MNAAIIFIYKLTKLERVELPTLWLNCQRKIWIRFFSYSSPVTPQIMFTFVLQRFVGRQRGESACRVAGQEVLLRYVSFGFQFHVCSNPNGGQSHGFKHSAAAREEAGDPWEQRHCWSGKACREIRNRCISCSEVRQHDSWHNKLMKLFLSNNVFF